MILVLMEYIIDDKGNNLKFVINKKIHCLLRLKSLDLNTEQIAKGTCITESKVEKIINYI